MASNVLMGFFFQLAEIVTTNHLGFLPVSTQGTRLMDQGFDDSLSYFEPASRDNSRCVEFLLVASSNSFLLCKREEDAGVLIQDYYVCNPLTRQHRVLPKPPDTTLDFLGTFICGGDGYPCLDWVTYKVVLGSDISELHFKVAIFSSQTGEWVELHLSSTFEFYLPWQPQNNGIPLAMSESETVCLASTSYTDKCFVVFNAKQKTDQLQRVNIPRPEFDVVDARLFQSKGRIYVASESCKVTIELWELNEDKWIWDLKYNVKTVEILTGGFEYVPGFIGLDSSNPAFALICLYHMNAFALVNLKEKSYVLTSPHPNTRRRYICEYIWHSYQWPPCL